LRKEDLEQVTRFAVALKNRIAALVGDVTSLFIPDDFGVAGVMISELLVQMKPGSAVDVVKRMVGWYEMIPLDKRQKLENHEDLGRLMVTGNTAVRNVVMNEYDKSLGSKFVRASVRHVLTLPLLPLHFANMPVSAALAANVGKRECADTFTAIEEKLPVVATTLQKSLAVAFGVLVLLANCADGADGKDRQGQINALGARASGRVMERLPDVLLRAKGHGKREGGGGQRTSVATLAGEVVKTMVRK
jgi:hypothetical protein